VKRLLPDPVIKTTSPWLERSFKFIAVVLILAAIFGLVWMGMELH
jgi:hypothetical protein